MNDELEKQLRQQLRASEEKLDAPTLARLHAARNRALGTAGNHREGRWPATWLAASTAAGAALIALFLGYGQSPDEAQLPVAELESTLLAAAGSEGLAAPAGEEVVSGGTDTAETLDLIENLDFYEWLSQQETPEQPT
ncbi:MAG: hypothetical protein KJ049_08525 [Gammaproteobacteria bacterium]|nr:hypothetical protein [Gammaproteobacteria bacterium]